MVIGNDGYAVHKPYRSVKSAARFLNDLSRLNQALTRGTPHPDGAHFAEALSQILRLAHSNYRIYFISDFQPHMTSSDHWRDAFRSLSRHNEVVAIRVFDPLEEELPPADSYTVTDGTSPVAVPHRQSAPQKSLPRSVSAYRRATRPDLSGYAGGLPNGTHRICPSPDCRGGPDATGPAAAAPRHPPAGRPDLVATGPWLVAARPHLPGPHRLGRTEAPGGIPPPQTC